MFFLRRPTAQQINEFLSNEAKAVFSYAEVGFSKSGTAPPGYVGDHSRVLLGHGEATWKNAMAAIQRWEMFNLGWVRLCWPDAPIEVGSTVAVLISHFGFYSLNACRVVYLIEETVPTHRFGFAYGTLDEHGESGEERFLVEWNTQDDSATYDLYAFSRPNHEIVKWTKPLARKLQRRFAKESLAAMQKATKP